MKTCRPVRLPREHSAFTLIEVVIAMTLLALLSGMVFGIVGLSVQAASSMRQSQRENDSVNRLIALFRQTFQSLPGTAILTLKITEPGTPAMQELTISGAPETFPFGPKPLSYKDSVIGLQGGTDSGHVSDTKQPLFSLGLSREDLIPLDPNQTPGLSRSVTEGMAAPDAQGRNWLPLLTDVVSLNWRFYKEADDTWEEEWSGTALPQLVEMTLLLDGRTKPIRVIYALPVIKLAGANKALAIKPDPTKPAATGVNGAPPGAAPQKPGAPQPGGSGQAPPQGKGQNGRGAPQQQPGGRGAAPAAQQPAGGGKAAAPAAGGRK